MIRTILQHIIIATIMLIMIFAIWASVVGIGYLIIGKSQYMIFVLGGGFILGIFTTQYLIIYKNILKLNTEK